MSAQLRYRAGQYIAVKPARWIVNLAGETVEVELPLVPAGSKNVAPSAIDIAVRRIFGRGATWTTTDSRARICVWRPVPKEWGGGVALIGLFAVRAKEAK